MSIEKIEAENENGGVKAVVYRKRVEGGVKFGPRLGEFSTKDKGTL